MSLLDNSLALLLKVSVRALSIHWPIRNFIGFLIDGTDNGKVEDELIVALYCKRDDVLKEIKSCAGYLSVVTPNKVIHMD